MLGRCGEVRNGTLAHVRGRMESHLQERCLGFVIGVPPGETEHDEENLSNDILE